MRLNFSPVFANLYFLINTLKFNILIKNQTCVITFTKITFLIYNLLNIFENYGLIHSYTIKWTGYNFKLIIFLKYVAQLNYNNLLNMPTNSVDLSLYRGKWYNKTMIYKALNSEMFSISNNYLLIIYSPKLNTLRVVTKDTNTQSICSGFIIDWLFF